jgi:hypothetical protein
VSRELREGWEKLNAALRRVETRLEANHGSPAMVKLAGGWLSWDGEFLWVIDAKRKDKLLNCSKELRLEATRVLPALVAKTGIKLIPKTPTG